MDIKERFENAIKKYQAKDPELSRSDASIRAIEKISPEFWEKNKHLLDDPFSRPLFGSYLQIFLETGEI